MTLMNNTGALAKTFITIFAIGGVIWLGAGIARTVIGFDAFIPGTAEIKIAQSEAMRLHTIWLYTMLGAWTGFSFAISAVGGVGAVVAMRARVRNNGWIMMSALLFCLLIPGQVWLTIQDIDLWSLFDSATGIPLASYEEILDVFLRRTTEITSSVVTGLSFLVAVTILLILVWRPLTREDSAQPNTEDK